MSKEKWTDKQLAMARGLDEALEVFAGGESERRTSNVELRTLKKNARALGWALRRAIFLAEAVKGEIAWMSFVNLVMNAFGSAEDLEDPGMRMAVLRIVAWRPLRFEPFAGDDANEDAPILGALPGEGSR